MTLCVRACAPNVPKNCAGFVKKTPTTARLVNGPSPAFFEKVNGRLAMNGFVMGTVVQQITGDSYAEQLVHEAPFVLAVSALLTYASYKTDDMDVWPAQKPFVSSIETLNGRVAMLGMLAGLLQS